jgi:hypothetical protein
MDNKKEKKFTTEDFLESLTSATDGDLLHISEGTSGEVGLNVFGMEDNFENEDEE